MKRRANEILLGHLKDRTTGRKKKQLPMVGEFVMKLEAKVDGLGEELKAVAEVVDLIKPRTLAPLAGALEQFCKTASKIINSMD